MGAWHGNTAANHTDLQSRCGQPCVFAVRVWSNLCICSPSVDELVRSNLAPDFPLFHVKTALKEDVNSNMLDYFIDGSSVAGQKNWNWNPQ